jgi:hypothetical protein
MDVSRNPDLRRDPRSCSAGGCGCVGACVLAVVSHVDTASPGGACMLAVVSHVDTASPGNNTNTYPYTSN